MVVYHTKSCLISLFKKTMYIRGCVDSGNDTMSGKSDECTSFLNDVYTRRLRK